VGAKQRLLDPDEIAKALGAERVGPIHASGGYFGAMAVAVAMQALRRKRHKKH